MKIIVKIETEEEIINSLKDVFTAGFKFGVISGNPTFKKNFWKLYKNKESELFNAFPKASVWKHPESNEWRFYFNKVYKK